MSPGLKVTEQVNEPARSFNWIDALLGLAVGAAGGALGSVFLTSSLVSGTVLGSLFGLAFGLFFAHRATSSGAGLIWGLGAAFLLWLVLPAGILPLLIGSGHSMAKLADGRDQFPELVAYLICLGMPVGVTLGVRGSFRGKLKNQPFHWWRAIMVGGFSGVLGGMIFARWSVAGDFFPLIGGLAEPHSRVATVAVEFGVAMFIGSSFGLLFRHESSGIGLGVMCGWLFGVIWWYPGPMIFLPLLLTGEIDWRERSLCTPSVPHGPLDLRRRDSTCIPFAREPLYPSAAP